MFPMSFPRLKTKYDVCLVIILIRVGNKAHESTNFSISHCGGGSILFAACVSVYVIAQAIPHICKAALFLFLKVQWDNRTDFYLLNPLEMIFRQSQLVFRGCRDPHHAKLFEAFLILLIHIKNQNPKAFRGAACNMLLSKLRPDFP